MTVKIEGMEMPKCCSECRFYEFSNMTCIALPIYDHLGYRVSSQSIENEDILFRLCPLQEVKE